MDTVTELADGKWAAAFPGEMKVNLYEKEWQAREYIQIRSKLSSFINESLEGGELRAWETWVRSALEEYNAKVRATSATPASLGAQEPTK